MRPAGLWSVAIGALACGVIQLTPPPLAPVNTCGGPMTNNPTCESEVGDASVDGGAPVRVGGACSGGSFEPILVVNVPVDGPNVGGNTFAIPTSRANEIGNGSKPGGQCTTGCVFLPPLASISNGFLNVQYGLGVALWPPGGLRPNEDTNDTTLPITATFHPLVVGSGIRCEGISAEARSPSAGRGRVHSNIIQLGRTHQR